MVHVVCQKLSFCFKKVLTSIIGPNFLFCCKFGPICFENIYNDGFALILFFFLLVLLIFWLETKNKKKRKNITPPPTWLLNQTNIISLSLLSFSKSHFTLSKDTPNTPGVEPLWALNLWVINSFLLRFRLCLLAHS